MEASMPGTDVITQEVIRARLDGIVREMQAAVLRTGFSTIIRESHDFSAGITDRMGNVVGQYSPLPPHLGAYPECVKGVLQFYAHDDMEDGDCFLVNHPYYSGCPHPNDMVVVLPVFHEGNVVAFCASMGHKSDIGGQSPGSRNTLARDVFGEGLQIMPVKFLSKREPLKETFQFLRSNSRTPELVLGDLGAQAGALWSIGATRLKGLMDEYGQETVVDAFEQIGLRTEARIRQVFEQWKDGVYEAEAFTDDIVDPTRKLRLHVAAFKEGDSLTLDFSGTDDQSLGPINARPPFVLGMAYFATIAMIDPGIPNNFGVSRAVECRFREGTVLNPTFPTPVGFYSMTMATIEDIIFEAVSKAAGKAAVAHNASSGMVVMGTVGGGRKYVQYELLMSGNGAYYGGDGWTGTGHSWAGGSKLTSVEILESEFDIELKEFALIQNSGGPGEFRGGLGLRREYVIKRPSRYAGGSPRNLAPAHGVQGGFGGMAGAVTVNAGSGNEHRYSGLISNVMLEVGDTVLVETGSAGGVGDPKDRDRQRVINDLRNGYITTEAAVQIYGLDEKTATEALALLG
jgi:N-methylhydantoinase B